MVGGSSSSSSSINSSSFLLKVVLVGLHLVVPVAQASAQPLSLMRILAKNEYLCGSIINF